MAKGREVVGTQLDVLCHLNKESMVRIIRRVIVQVRPHRLVGCLYQGNKLVAVSDDIEYNNVGKGNTLFDFISLLNRILAGLGDEHGDAFSLCIHDVDMPFGASRGNIVEEVDPRTIEISRDLITPTIVT